MYAWITPRRQQADASRNSSAETLVPALALGSDLSKDGASSSGSTSDLLCRQDQTGGHVHADHAHRQAAIDTVSRHDLASREPTQRLSLRLRAPTAPRRRRTMLGRQMKSRGTDDHPQRIDNPVKHHRRSLSMITQPEPASHLRGRLGKRPAAGSPASRSSSQRGKHDSQRLGGARRATPAAQPRSAVREDVASETSSATRTWASPNCGTGLEFAQSARGRRAHRRRTYR